MNRHRVALQADNRLIVEATHETCDRDRPNSRFAMKGNALTRDDLRVWEVKQSEFQGIRDARTAEPKVGRE